MKKKILYSTLAGVVFIACIIVIILYAVGVFTPIKELALNTDDVQKEFYIGESFEFDGLKVKGHKGDQNWTEITDFTVDSSKFKSEEAGEYEIVVNYQKGKSKYTVNVLPNNDYALKVLAIINDNENVVKVENMSVTNDNETEMMYIGNSGYQSVSTNSLTYKSWHLDGYDYDYTVEGQNVSAIKSPYINESYEKDLTFTQNIYKTIFNSHKKWIEDNVICASKISEKDGVMTIAFTSVDQSKPVADFNVNLDLETNLATFAIGENEVSSLNTDCTIPQMPEVAWIKGLVLKTDDVQKEFYIGETFNYNNLKVEEINNDGYQYKASDFKVDFSKFDNQKAGEYEIVVKQGNVQNSYTVKVLSNEEYFAKVFAKVMDAQKVEQVKSLSTSVNNEVNRIYNENAGYEFFYQKGFKNEFWLEDGVKYIAQFTNDGYKYSKTSINYQEEFGATYNDGLSLAQNKYISLLSEYSSLKNLTIDKIVVEGKVVSISFIRNANLAEGKSKILMTVDSETCMAVTTETFSDGAVQNISVNTSNLIPTKQNVKWEEV